jgi:N-acetylmuramoyl-L-alanine amidase
VLLIAGLAVPAAASAKKAQAAQAQFVRAEKLRDSLNGRQAEQRQRHDYQRVIDAYRRVYYLDPGSPKAAASVVAVAELLADMGHQFEDAKMLRAAVGQYKFLLREYPASRYRSDALFTIAQTYKDDLHDPAQAKAAYQDFLKRYPRNQRTGEARQAIAQLGAEHVQDRSTAAKAKAPVPASDKGLPRVRRVRYWSAPDSTRVAIDLDTDTTFHAERLTHPDRIVFDLHWTRLAPGLADKSIKVQDGLLKEIRAAEYKPGDARIVLQVEKPAKYSAFLLPNPDRLIIDLQSPQAQAAVLKQAPVNRAKSNTTAAEYSGGDAASSDGLAAAANRGEDSAKGNPEEADQAGVGKNSEKPAAALRAPKIITDEADSAATAARERAVLPPSVKRPSRVVIREGGDEMQAREARPTSSGDRSLVRTLGLKIGKIVIDPGHGGHDTGTIGPHGLEEKDLVLDVGLRLGKLLEQRLGADVVYTRDDDTFVPLETRTVIANQAQADLFISIHANSSHDPDARGIETYYLNFTTSSDALEVAARENAVSDQSIHQLQELVKTITLQDKIEESREFAADVQHALYTGLVGRSRAIRDRGVKKAPFVVLIGARMPSILAEISFVSNPQDERKLRSSAYRQRIAQSLYRGISRYASGLSGIKVASSAAQGDGQ